jgi:glucose-1-phosphate cytidylyltransferase
MDLYAQHGFKNFMIACGYKGQMIKEYFYNFSIHSNDYRINLADGSLKVLNPSGIDWEISVVDTGPDTMMGGRIRRLRKWLEDDTFMVTYGDGLSNVDVSQLVAFHRSHGKAATVTAVPPPARFGALALDGDRVGTFSEKPPAGQGWINGGFFVFEPKLLDYLESDEAILEREPLERLAAEGELMAFRHQGFWQPMDTLREKEILESLWASGSPPWMTR